MSLILEALRKLEKEKSAPDRGVTVVTAAPWAPRNRSSAGVLLGIGILVAAGIAIGLAWRPDPQPRSRTVEAAPRAVPIVPATAPGVRRPAPADAPLSALSTHRPLLPGARPPAARAPLAPRPSVPMRATPAPAELRLQAISERDGRPVAVLNERVVHEGDEFDGILVVRIGPAQVEVEVGGKRRILTF